MTAFKLRENNTVMFLVKGCTDFFVPILDLVKILRIVQALLCVVGM